MTFIPSLSVLHHPPTTPYAFQDLSPRSSFILLALILSFFTLVRLAFASAIGFGVDETYYLSVGRSLSLSYLDHPPLTFWIAHLITLVQNIPSSLFARAFFILLSIPTLFLLYDLTAYLFSRKAGIYAVFIYSVAPVLGLADSAWVLPDGPLIFFFLVTASCLARLSVEPQNHQNITRHKPLHLWILAGIAFGFASLTKYHAPLWLIGIFLYLLFEKNARYWLFKPYPWIALLAAFTLSLPVLIWNAQNEWASFAFQASRSLSHTPSDTLNFTGLLVSFIGQALWLSPWIFLIIISSIITIPFAHSKSHTFCLFLSLPLILFFSTMTLLSGTGLPHWQMPGYVFLIPITGHFLAKIKKQQIIIPWAIFILIVFLISAFTITSHTKYGILRDLFPQSLRINDPTFDATNWSDIQKPLNIYLQADPNAVIIATHWIHAAKIDFITGSSRPVVIPFSEPHHFPYRYSLSQMKHDSAILVVPRESMVEFVASIKRFYPTASFLETIKIKRGKQTINHIELWHLSRHSHPPHS